MTTQKNNSLVLVTGANGFVGRHLCKALDKREVNFIPAVRVTDNSPLFKNQVVVSDIDKETDWSLALVDVDCVVHLAAHVHQMDKVKQGNADAYSELNFLATINLAKQAAKAGVKRFVFVSSVSVYGVHESESVIDENTTCDPQSHYAHSKYQAELSLLALGDQEDIEIVIIRPPLVYGASNKGNFVKLLDLVRSGLPLPFGCVDNRRSMVFVDNLVDLLATVVKHPQAAGQVFLVSDDEDVSTAKLIKSLSLALGNKPRLLTVPLLLLRALLMLLGKRTISQQLLGSLRLDISKTKYLLDWKPPVSFEDGIKKTASAYLAGLE